MRIAKTKAKPGELEIEMVPMADLTPYAGNARTHDSVQVSQIVASVKAFGWTNPLLIDEKGRIIAGHGRLQAAVILTMDRVPCLRLTGLSEAQKAALTIADNKIAMNAGWDDDMLREGLRELQGMDFDLGLTGFGDMELSLLFAPPITGLSDPDEVPEVPVVPVSMLGDVWQLGRHRLVCGDSTSKKAVDAALNGAKPHLMVTDPPYGVEYDASWRSEAGKHSPGMKTTPNHKHAKGVVTNDDRADWSEAWALFSGDVAYIWHDGNQSHKVALSILACGFEIRSQIIWAKSQFVIGRSHYHQHHEPCWYAVRKGGTGHWEGDRKQSTLWQIDKPQKSETGHSTQKPIDCMKIPIENNSAPGDAIYEPFCGSGTTIIAAEMTGRTCHAIELSPAYCDVIVTRWETFTGETATLEQGGTMSEVRKQRRTVAA